MGDINKTTTKKEKKRLTETGRNCPSTRERERTKKKCQKASVVVNLHRRRRRRRASYQPQPELLNQWQSVASLSRKR